MEKRNILTEVVQLEKIIVTFRLFYPLLQEYEDRIWEAFGRSDIKSLLSSVNLFTIMIPKRAYENKDNNGLDKLLNFTNFDSQLEEDLATGKRKVTSYSDL